MSLLDTYDAALLDLDGTVYLGEVVIDHVPTALAAAKQAGVATLFVTNNASRPPAVVAESLQRMGIAAEPDDVFTSPMAAADMLAQSHPTGSKVLVVGTDYLRQTIAEVGLVPVRLAADKPVAVVQGHSPDTGWADLAEASIALRAGADWVACNTDATLPTDRGMLPGNGSMVAALVAATGLTPRVAGKPARPLLDSAARRSGARHPLVVGDRLDTDIEAAVNAGLPCLMPLTGVNTAADLVNAPPQHRPTHVSFDLRGLTDPAQVVALEDPDRRIHPDDDSPRPDGWSTTVAGRVIRLARQGVAAGDSGSTLQALGAVLAAAWADEPAATWSASARQPAAANDDWRVQGVDEAAVAALIALGIEQQSN